MLRGTRPTRIDLLALDVLPMDFCLTCSTRHSITVLAVEHDAQSDFLISSTGSGASVAHVLILVIVRVGTLQLGRSLGCALGDTARFDSYNRVST